MPRWLPMSDAERFWSKVRKSDGCWLWVGAINKHGYGNFSVLVGSSRRRKTVLAHRFSFEITNGAVGAGRLVCHSCDNPICVNPAHLWEGSARENVLDMHRKRRHTNQSGVVSGYGQRAINRKRWEFARCLVSLFAQQRDDASPVLGMKRRYGCSETPSQCRRGHTGDHLWIERGKRGRLHCRECEREWSREYARRKRASMVVAA